MFCVSKGQNLTDEIHFDLLKIMISEPLNQYVCDRKRAAQRNREIIQIE